MGQRYFEHAAVVAEGEPEQFCGTDIALGPIGAGDHARPTGPGRRFRIPFLALEVRDGGTR